MISAFMITPDDTVAVVNREIKKGEEIEILKGSEIIKVTSNDDIPVYHKIAVVAVPKGGNVIKYNEFIGQALEDIKVGDYVHLHNITDILFGAIDMTEHLI